jgi:serine/threonine protein kinase
VSTPRTPPGPSQIRAVSASEDSVSALAAFRAAKESDYDKLVGETLDGRYFVEKKIGEGGMGVVFAARHSVIERPLAIKVLKREVMRDTATIKRFIQEAKAASRIGHPNIVDVTDFGTTPDGMTYSVMEYVHGETLGTTLRNAAPFPQARAIKIAVQIARALGAAHDKGIVHRDLKPENVFLIDRDGRTDFVKIVDFGIAKVVPVGGSSPNEPRLTRAGSVFGTPEYMAPEQAAGKGDADGRVDIYALGVILYEMITGRVPHRGDSTVRTLAMVMLDPVDPPSKVRPELNIDPGLEQVVLRALAKKREARFQTMGELIAALEQVQPMIGKSLTGSPVYALSPVPPGASIASDPAIAVATPFSTDSRPALPASSPSGSRPLPSPSTSPITRRAHEPEFTHRDKPATFEHVFTEESPIRRRRSWPLVLLGVLIVAGAATAMIVVVTSRNRVTTPPRDAAVVVAHTPDAAVTHVDAAVIVPAVLDGPDIVVVKPDAGQPTYYPRPVRDAGVAVAPDAAGTMTVHGLRGVSIQVITKPEGANLYAGTTYTGPGGTNIERPLGTKLEIECRMSGYKSGRIKLDFDGRTEYALCVLERIKVCVKDLKNPFDDCQEPSPGAPKPPNPIDDP